MKQKLLSLMLALAVLAALINVSPVRAASAVVGTGTPASCTEAALNAALASANAGGGTVTFNCGPSPVTINLTVQKIMNLASVTIDGGGLVTLKGMTGFGIKFNLDASGVCRSADLYQPGTVFTATRK
ncbi:MAG: hypothetical protein HGA82_02845 [Anaerolineales bacterium]|nr:hypothetical protein [Anaerolineales bacterium]